MVKDVCIKCGEKLQQKGTEDQMCLECYLKWEQPASMQITEITVYKL